VAYTRYSIHAVAHNKMENVHTWHK